MEAADTRSSPLNEQALQRLLEAVEALLLLVDMRGRLVYVSPACRRLLGYEPEELLGRWEEELIPLGLAREARLSFASGRGGEQRLRQRLLVRRPDGSNVHMRFDATPVQGPGGAIEGIAIVAFEVLPEPGRARPARSAGPEPGERDLIDHLPAVVYIAEPGAEGRWRYVSGQIEPMLGYTPAEWTSDPTLWGRRLHSDDRERVIAEEDADAARGAPLASEYRLLARDSTVVWVRDEAVMRLDPDGVARYEGMLIDITERKAFESRLEFFADHDSLTGLLTRRRIKSEIETELRLARRRRDPSSVLLVDIDDLKGVNDSCGHAVGDELICGVAEVLVERLRGSDSVARLGGDEFVALMRGAAPSQALAIAQELVETVGERSLAITRGVAPTGISVGVTGLEPSHDVADILKLADEAMYAAKRGGGGQVACALSG
ncbi:MAG: diguanylate cyclase [Actinomycetota bacterium]|nr:diguanylate cyclase [Actinomycetota bacterium]